MHCLPSKALLLAPMVELSHRPLRELITSFGGCDRYYTEMAGAPAYLSGAAYDAWFLDPLPEPVRTVIQFYSPDTPRMADAVRKLVGQRAAEDTPVGGIDLNFGCAAPHIEKAGGGVSWMKDARGAAAMVAAVRSEAQGISLSAKLRLGYEEEPERLAEFCLGLADAGLDYIVLHPRLKDQKFRRTAKWSTIRALAATIPVPVIGNGDIRGYDSYR
ncbi:MAG: tRNA-dihydrouridine synthase family protein, partial [Spirochaetales bacterium]